MIIVKEEVLRALRGIVGEENMVMGRDSLEPYSHDETPGLKIFPEVVVKPETREEVLEILRLAHKEKVPVTPRGGGTGLAGGAVPLSDGIVLSMERMDRIKEIDRENRMAVVEPGVITEDLSKKVEEYGLFYPPDPASLDSCTLGGNIATGAGGARTVKYGTTRNYVYGLEVVLPKGELLRLGGKFLKNATGYSLLHLFIGSEGTLGVFTEAILRLLPKPEYKVDLLIPYKRLEDAVRTALRLPLTPTTLEFMERDAIKAAEKFLEKRLPFSDAEVHLLLEFDGEKEELEKVYERVGEIALEDGAVDVFVADNRPSQERIWEGRRAISRGLKAMGKVASQDVVVPKSRIPEFIDRLRRVREKYRMKVVCFGHLGDGNVHVNLIKEREEALNLVPTILKEIFQTVVDLGGIISGEHGIGLVKKPYLKMALSSPYIQLMRGIKRVFDPNNILNPGKIFDVYTS